MLIGEYYQNIDEKGRINVPSKFIMIWASPLSLPKVWIIA
ncbi:MAG: MraZ N-terminal domain containing protein [Clostridia bacterium]|nr:MraZ N-terminal domain containing protein [Clostridia bacterium]